MYTQKEKESIDELGPQRVFAIKHSEIPKGVTQCEKHIWKKLNDMEIACTQCPTALIVAIDDERILNL